MSGMDHFNTPAKQISHRLGRRGSSPHPPPRRISVDAPLRSGAAVSDSTMGEESVDPNREEATEPGTKPPLRRNVPSLVSLRIEAFQGGSEEQVRSAHPDLMSGAFNHWGSGGGSRDGVAEHQLVGDKEKTWPLRSAKSVRSLEWTVDLPPPAAQPKEKPVGSSSISAGVDQQPQQAFEPQHQQQSQIDQTSTLAVGIHAKPISLQSQESSSPSTLITPTSIRRSTTSPHSTLPRTGSDTSIRISPAARKRLGLGSDESIEEPASGATSPMPFRAKPGSPKIGTPKIGSPKITKRIGDFIRRAGSTGSIASSLGGESDKEERKSHKNNESGATVSAAAKRLSKLRRAASESSIDSSGRSSEADVNSLHLRPSKSSDQSHDDFSSFTSDSENEDGEEPSEPLHASLSASTNELHDQWRSAPAGLETGAEEAGLASILETETVPPLKSVDGISSVGSIMTDAGSVDSSIRSLIKLNADALTKMDEPGLRRSKSTESLGIVRPRLQSGGKSSKRSSTQPPPPTNPFPTRSRPTSTTPSRLQQQLLRIISHSDRLLEIHSAPTPLRPSQQKERALREFMELMEEVQGFLDVIGGLVNVRGPKERVMDAVRMERELDAVFQRDGAVGLHGERLTDLKDALKIMNDQLGIALRAFIGTQDKLSIRPAEAYRIEAWGDVEEVTGRASGAYCRRYDLDHVSDGAGYYRKSFYRKEHKNFVGICDKLGSVIVSLRHQTSADPAASSSSFTLDDVIDVYRSDAKEHVEDDAGHKSQKQGWYIAILRTKEHPDQHITIQDSQLPFANVLQRRSTSKTVLQALNRHIQPGKMRKVDDPKIEDEILRLDELQVCYMWDRQSIYCPLVSD
ncbi:signal-induced proliferation-associated 1-like protein 3 [Rhizophlyctis rosea]|uniref:Signal-induced proliferation-associated 1-like protein 3 n=1 Tax=Rhizophlyctis rosea TaxID=64517 RepID=A0AAD5S960_9FUNG|nr:signal-induced proliferation-associated 1-like protein 3 [Rhizophlyctis rosea]